MDDEAANRLIFRATFSDEFDVVLARDGEEALEILAVQPIGVLLTDQRMPKMSGIQLCERARDNHPDVLRVVVTAFSDEATAVDAINRGGVSRFVRKPWEEVELRQVLRDCVARVFLAQTVRRLRESLYDRDRLLGESKTLARLQRDIGHIGGSLTQATHRLLELHRGLPVLDDTEQHESMRQTLVQLDEYVRALTELAPRNRRIDQISRPMSQRLLPLLQAAAEVVRGQTAADLRINVACEPQQLVWVDANQLSRLLVRLIGNAARMTSAQRGEPLRVAVRASGAGGTTTIRISDHGPPVQAASFTQWFSGTGAHADGPPLVPRCDAALLECAPIVAALGGTLDAAASPDDGFEATWTLAVPAQRPRPAPILRQS